MINSISLSSRPVDSTTIVRRLMSFNFIAYFLLFHTLHFIFTYLNYFFSNFEKESQRQIQLNNRKRVFRLGQNGYYYTSEKH